MAAYQPVVLVRVLCGGRMKTLKRKTRILSLYLPELGEGLRKSANYQP
jgi:hypothetical protein